MPAPPKHHALEALAVSAPYRAALGLSTPLVTLERDGPSVLKGGTAKLLAQLEPEARLLGRGQGPERLAPLCERSWFAKPEDCETPLATHLCDLADKHLTLTGAHTRLRPHPPNDRAEAAMRWRVLSLYLPQDLLIAALCNLAAVEPPCDHVELLDPPLARMLDAPVAETHLHIGAALDFGLLWQATLHELAWGRGKPRYPMVDDGLGETSEHARWLTAAALIRHLLFAFLWWRERGRPDTEDFARFRRVCAPQIAARVGSRADEDTVLQAWVAAELRLSLRTAGLAVPLARMRKAHRLLSGSRSRKVERVDDLLARDPLAHWLPPSEGFARPETRLLARALAYLRSAGAKDLSFARAFWQYVRLRTRVFARLVQTPGTAGLDWFGRHYDRLRAYRGPLDGQLFASALDLHQRSLDLEAIEVRTQPGKSPQQVRDELRWLARQQCDHRPPAGRRHPQIGMVYHFIKRAVERKPRRAHADPRAIVFATRYGRWFHDQDRRARAMATALARHPELLLVLRGVDVASRELAVPTWPLAPLYAQVRRGGDRAARILARRRPSWRVEPLRATAHVGEDFRRLSEGLRRVHEAVDFGLLRAGDRIGHGLALGWDPKDWTERFPQTQQPLDERLDDLLWELERYRSRDIDYAAPRRDRVEDQIRELAPELYGHEKTPGIDDLLAARRLRFDEAKLRSLDYPRLPRQRPDDPAARLLHDHLCDPDLYLRGAQVIDVRADEAECEFLTEVQRWLCGQLALLGITIESNPSSNLLIGDFSDLRDHPTFQLAPTAKDEPRPGATLPISVNSDDPLTFATCLADEYAHMYFALIGDGLATTEALAWLDEAREQGWRSRFTLPASAEHSAIAELRSAWALPTTQR